MARESCVDEQQEGRCDLDVDVQLSVALSAHWRETPQEFSSGPGRWSGMFLEGGTLCCAARSISPRF
jgi:hypothetical protein